MEDNATGKEQEPFDELRDYLEKEVRQREAAPMPKPEPPKAPFKQRYPRVVLSAQLLFILAAAIFTYSAVPEIKLAASAPKHLRLGPYGDPGTDDCVANLWKIGGGMEGAGKLLCPVSGLPYKVEKGIANCPSPEAHALSALRFIPYRGVISKGAE